jgi:hypothetical protein
MQRRRHDLRPDAVAVSDSDGYRFGHFEVGPFAMYGLGWEAIYSKGLDTSNDGSSEQNSGS